MQIEDLPALNAALNGLASIFLITAYVLIRNGRRNLHKRFMLAALATSALFLASYVTYHANVGSRPFPGQGLIRVVYFAILIPHVVLADALRAVIGPSITIVDSAETTAKAVQAELLDRGLLRAAGPSLRPILQATDSPERFARVGSRFLGESFDAGQVELVDITPIVGS